MSSGHLKSKSEIPVGKSVFVNRLGDDATASRERLDLPFASIDAAVTAAQSGDTIVVLPGTYECYNPLHKEGVKWKMIGFPNLELYSNAYWSDSVGATNIDITGSANVIAYHLNPVVRVVNLGTEVNILLNSVEARQAPLNLSNGGGIINVVKDIICTVTSYTIALYQDANYTINTRDIINYAYSGSFSGGVLYLSYSGNSVINVRNITHEGTSGGCVFYSHNDVSTGTLTINLEGKMHYKTLTPIAFANKSIFHISGNLIINGDIDGGVCSAISIDYNSRVKTLIHNGKSTNDGVNTLVIHSAPNSELSLNGSYESTNPNTITLSGTNKTKINGTLINKSTVATRKTGVYLLNNNTLLLETVKIVFDNVDAASFGLFGSIPSNVKIIHNVSSNADVLDITNLITGTNYIYDTDVE